MLTPMLLSKLRASLPDLLANAKLSIYSSSSGHLDLISLDSTSSTTIDNKGLNTDQEVITESPMTQTRL